MLDFDGPSDEPTAAALRRSLDQQRASESATRAKAGRKGSGYSKADVRAASRAASLAASRGGSEEDVEDVLEPALPHYPTSEPARRRSSRGSNKSAAIDRVEALLRRMSSGGGVATPKMRRLRAVDAEEGTMVRLAQHGSRESTSRDDDSRDDEL